MPEIFVFRSPSIDIKIETEWEIDVGPMVKFRFYDASSGKRVPFVKMRAVQLRTEKTGLTFAFHDELATGELVMPRDKGLLAGAKEVKVVLMGNPPTAGYQIVQNETVVLDLKTKEAQVFDVVLAKKKELKSLIVNAKEEATGGPVLARVYILDPRAGKRVKIGVTGRGLRLAAGKYVVAVWKKGFRLKKQKLNLDGEKDVGIEVKLEPAPRLKGTILGGDGKALPGASVRIAYIDEDYLRQEHVLASDKGEFEIPFDNELQAVLLVNTRENAPRLVELTKKSVEQDLEVTLGDGCEVTGKLTFEKGVARGTDYAVLWARQDYPALLVNFGEVNDRGEYSVRLEPGTYCRYLEFELDEEPYAIVLEEVKIPAAEQHQLNLITLDKEALSKRKDPEELLRK